jgi:DNA-binding NtrC family response regulator
VEDDTLRWNDAIRALKLKLILGRLASHGGDGKAAARSLGLPVSTFYRDWRQAKRLR